MDADRSAAIPRERVKDAYDKAALDCARIVSWADDDDGYDLDCLPYYEGRRDALKALLEPDDECDELVSTSHIVSRHGDACDA